MGLDHYYFSSVDNYDTFCDCANICGWENYWDARLSLTVIVINDMITFNYNRKLCPVNN